MSEWQKQNARLERLQEEEINTTLEMMKKVTDAEAVGRGDFSVGLRDGLMAQAGKVARINSRMKLGDYDVVKGSQELASIDKQLETFVNAAAPEASVFNLVKESRNLNAGEVGKLMLPTDLKAAKMQNDFLKVINTMNSPDSGKVKPIFGDDGSVILQHEDGERISLNAFNDIMTGENPEYPLQFVKSPDAAIDPLYQAFNKRTKNLSPYLVDKQITERKNGKDITTTKTVYEIGEDSDYKKDLLEVVQPILDDKKAMETYWPNLKGGQNAGPWVNDDNQRKEAQKLLAERAHNLYGPKVDVDETKVVEKPSLTRDQEIALANDRKNQKIKEQELELKRREVNRVDQGKLEKWRINSQAAQQIVKNKTGATGGQSNLPFLAELLNNRAVKKGGKKDVTFRVGNWKENKKGEMDFVDDPINGELYVENPSAKSLEEAYKRIPIDLTNEEQILNLINDVDFPKEEDLSRFDPYRKEYKFEFKDGKVRYTEVKKEVKTEEKSTEGNASQFNPKKK